MIVSTISEKVDKSDVESISSETIKDESGLSLSRAYSVTSEPPAYKKPTSSSVRIARLIAITVVAVALILGTAIVLAAYLQTRHSNNHNSVIHSAAPAASSTETNKAATVALPSALTGDAPTTSGANESSSSESSSEVVNDEKDHRRLDTDGELLEEFLENEGKILRLPTGGSDLDVDIDELTQMFLKRNPLDKSKCVVERRPFDSTDDLVKVLPITAKNASAVPLMPIISGERISIICSSDDDDSSSSSIVDLDEEDDSGLIHSRPILMPFDMSRPQIRIHPFNMMGGMPMPNSAIGPIPFPMMNQMIPPRSMRPQLPFNLTPSSFDFNNALLEQRLLNPLNVPPPPPQMRSPFQAFPAGQPFRFPESNLRQMRPVSPPPPPPPPFQSFHQRPLDSHAMAEKRFNLPSGLVPDNSQEKSHVPEHRGMDTTTGPVRPSLVTARPVPLFRERQPSPDFPSFPEGLLSLLEELPGILANEEQQQPTQRLSIQPGQPDLPVFRVPKFLLSTAGPKEVEANTEKRNGPIPLPARPVTLPFLQVPPMPAALVAKERSAPIPVNIPFLNVRNAAPSAPSQTGPAPDRRQSRSSFFERLMDSILSPVNNRNPSKNEKSSSVDSAPPVDTRAAQPVRTGGRGLRTMPENGPILDRGIVVARPIVPEDEAIAPEQDRRARAHFIQPRSLKVN